MVIFYFCKLMDSGTASAFVAGSVARLNVHLLRVHEHPRPWPMTQERCLDCSDLWFSQGAGPLRKRVLFHPLRLRCSICIGEAAGNPGSA